MDYSRKVVYEKRDPAFSDITIMIAKDSVGGYPVWDVYYRKDGYAYSFAFGLPTEFSTLSDAFAIATGNTADYLHLFH